MSRSTALSGRAETGLAQEAAEGFAAQGETLDLAQFFAEMVIIEAGISGAGQTEDGLAHPFRQATGAGPSAAGVCQSRLPVFAQAFLETTNLADAEREQCGGS